MIRNNYSKSQIFLLEFIVVVLFFAVCATICVSVFMKADRISKDSSRDVNAMVIARNAAECFKASAVGDPAEYFNLTPGPDGIYTMSFDQEFDETTQREAEYTLTIEIAEREQNLFTAQISVYEKQDDLAFYRISVDKYLGEPL